MSGPQAARRPPILAVTTLAIAAMAFPLGVLAGHRFVDVPDSNTFHDDIEAIAVAGVTTGCGSGKYCPKDLVTREQMAGFLNRLGALGAGKSPVVNADRLDGLDAGAFASAGHDHDADYLATGAKAADANLLDGQDASAFAGAAHDHDAAYLATGAKAADANLLDGQDATDFSAADHDHDSDYLATGGKAADADLLDGQEGSAYARGIKAVRLGDEVDLTSTATTVATLSLPVSSSHYTFFVFFTAQTVTSGGPVQCDLVRADDVVIHSRVAGTYGPYAEYGDLSLNYPVWIGDTATVRVDCRKLEPSATTAKISTRELQALAIGSGP